MSKHSTDDVKKRFGEFLWPKKTQLPTPVLECFGRDIDDGKYKVTVAPPLSGGKLGGAMSPQTPAASAVPTKLAMVKTHSATTTTTTTANKNNNNNNNNDDDNAVAVDAKSAKRQRDAAAVAGDGAAHDENARTNDAKRARVGQLCLCCFS